MDKLTLDEAQHVLGAGVERARQLEVPMNIAVTDDGGLLIAFVRMDGALKVSIDISQKKAKTAIMLNLPTADLFEICQPGGELYGLEQTSGGLVIFGGGIPISRDGDTIGAVGVSGGSVAQDIDVAEAALDGLAG